LGGVVAVVVDHCDARHAPADLEPALDAGKAREGPLGRHERDLELEAHADGRQSVEDVVASRELKRALAEEAPALEDLEAARHPTEGEPACDEVSARLEAVRDDALLDPRNQHLDVGLVEAEDRGAVEGYLVDELDERLADRLEGAVVVEMLGVDRGDDRDRRRELQE